MARARSVGGNEQLDERLCRAHHMGFAAHKWSARRSAALHICWIQQCV